MFKLLRPEDKDFLDNSNFAKNAVFYKDMLCFYDAYCGIFERRESLPNFCYVKKKELCLEGICLLIKMYATEFKFETIKLTLDYMKILYYTIASYSENDEVDKEVIIKEVDEYRLASFEYCNANREGFETKQKAVNDLDKNLKADIQKSQKLKKDGKFCFVFSIVMLILSILSISAPILVMCNFPDNKILFWGSIAGVGVGFIISIVLLVLSKKFSNTSSDFAFHIQTLKKERETSFVELTELQTKYYKVFCEKYEYKACFSEIFSRYSKILTIDEILAKASNYKILSYNMAYDIGRLFKSQQKEISEIVSDIENIVFVGDYKEIFSELYSQICEQDWLYYNSEIRLHFLRKFTDIGERDYDWKLDVNGKKISPFDVNLREISREMVAFSVEKGRKMITAPLSDFVKTKYFKGLDQLNFKNGYSVEELKKVKANYLKHFYNFDILSKLKNVFYDKKDNQKIKNLELPIDEFERVPTLVMMKLKILENLAGLSNSDAGVIKSLSQNLFKDESKDFAEIKTISEDDIEYPRFIAEKMEEFDDYYVYYVNGEKKIGYKI